MTLSIIIVDWNSGSLLRKCLDAIPAACRPHSPSLGSPSPLTCEVIVVDNASSDDSVALAKSSPQHFELMTLPTNVGFARANNLALARARGEILLLLNPDTEPRPGSFAVLIEHVRTRPRAGVVGGKLLNPDGTLQPSVRRFPNTVVLALVLSRLAHFLPNLPSMRQYLMRGFFSDRPQRVDQVMGACLAIRREAHQQVGSLDEGYWIWFEEVDYCRRMRAAGWEVWYEPGVEVVHHQATAFRQVPPLQKAWWFSRSALRYARKHLGPGSVLLVAALVPVMLVTGAGAAVVKRFGR